MTNDNKQHKLSDSTDTAIAYTPCYKPFFERGNFYNEDCNDTIAKVQFLKLTNSKNFANMQPKTVQYLQVLKQLKKNGLKCFQKISFVLNQET